MRDLRGSVHGCLAPWTWAECHGSRGVWQRRFFTHWQPGSCKVRSRKESGQDKAHKDILLGFPDPARTLSLGGDQVFYMWAFRRTVRIPAGSVSFSLCIPESPSESHLSPWTHSRLKQSHINSWLLLCMGTCQSCLILLKDTLNARGHSVRSPQGSSKPSNLKPLFSPHSDIGTIDHICLLPSSLPGSWLAFQVYIPYWWQYPLSLGTTFTRTNNAYSDISHI